MAVLQQRGWSHAGTGGGIEKAQAKKDPAKCRVNNRD